MMRMAESLSLKGDCVLTPVFFAGDANNLTKSDLNNLKDAHFKRIELSDAIYVVNKDENIQGTVLKKKWNVLKALIKKYLYEIKLKEKKLWK